MLPHSASLGAAVRDDHARARKLLSRYKEAWLSGDHGGAHARFRRFERAVSRHLAWEEQSIVQPLRLRFSMLHQYQVVQRDADIHVAVRAALVRIGELLVAGNRSGGDADRIILESVAALEVLLESHRTLLEDQLLYEMGDLLSPDAEEHAAGLLEARPPRRPD